jgi:S1-C subfamily serine protease
MGTRYLHLPLALLLISSCGSWAADGVVGDEPTPSPDVLARESDRVRVIERITAPTIAIFDRSGAGGGSGVVITPDGYALTNFHVAQPCGNFMKCGLSNGELVDAVIVGLDPTGDVALIKLVGRDDFTAAELGDSDQLRPGQWCIAAGNPFLLATDFRPTISYGMISGVHRYQYPAGTLLEYTDCIQTDAAVNPGNSGGPLFDEQGRLVGINGRCSFEKRGRVNVGVAYAISINQIKNFLGHLMSGRIVDHATLGATVSSDESGRVVVTNILEESDVYRRGLRIDDQIIAIGGRPMHTVNAVKNVLGIYPRGWRLPVSFVRDGNRVDIFARLAGVHASEELLQLVSRPDHPILPPDEPKPKDPKDKGKKPRPPGVEIGEPTIPPELARMFEPRRGFANYYFNRLHIERVLNTWRDAFNVDQLSGEWLIEGKLESGDRFQLVLRNEEAFMLTDLGQYHADLTKDLDTQLEPEGSGGLLLALAMWRRLGVVGPEQFGDVYYLGKAPYDGEEMFDVFVATYQSIESHFYFRTDDASLYAMELFTRGDRDPCELRFSQFEDRDQHMLPTRISSGFGGQHFDTLNLETVRLPERPAQAEPPADPDDSPKGT